MFPWKLPFKKSSPATTGERILIVAPHPDDEALGCAGVIRQAVNNGDEVKIIIVFDGAAHGNARVRYRETKAAMKLLGVSSANVIFLGFPDGKGLELWNNKNTSYPGVKYRFALNARTDFNWHQLVFDLKTILTGFDPGRIYIPSEHDEHGDHQVTAKAVKFVLADPGCALNWKVLYSYLIHWEVHYKTWPDTDISWSTVLQNNSLKSTLHTIGNPDTEVSLPAGFTYADKLEVIKKYSSQLRGCIPVLTKFAKTSEVFWTDCTGPGQDPSNAALAKLTV